MRKVNILIFALIFALCASGFAFAGNSEADTQGGLSNNSNNTVEFSLDHGKLLIDRTSISGKAILEISPYNSKNKLYEGPLAEYEPVKVDNGDYLITVTEISGDEVLFYHGILTVADDAISIFMDLNEAAVEDLSGRRLISPMAAGTQYEAEPNNTMNQAMTIYNDYDVYGRIYDANDIDWYKVKFASSGSANFWMGNIPSGEDFDLEVYNSSGTRLGRSAGTGSQELITINVTANTWYYIKAYGYGGSWSVSNYLLRAKVQSSYATMGWAYFFTGSNPPVYISSPYGPRDGTFHAGFDITTGVSGGITNRPIYNVRTGTVYQIGDAGARGLTTRIQTNSIDPNTNHNLRVIYQHMNSYQNYLVGDSVSTGGYIGAVGNTGTGTGSHLHFEVNKLGNNQNTEAATVNPELFFPNVAFTGYPSLSGLSNTDIFKNEVADYDCKHSFEYHFIPAALIDYVGQKEYDNWKTDIEPTKETFNIVDMLNYFNISKEKFEELEPLLGPEGAYDVDAIFSQDPTVIERHFRSTND